MWIYHLNIVEILSRALYFAVETTDFTYTLQYCRVITRFNIVRYYINKYRNWWRILIRSWIKKVALYLALTGELWGVICEYFDNSLPRYNNIALYYAVDTTASLPLFRCQWHGSKSYGQQYHTSTVYWCIASKLKAARNLYWMSNMFLWLEIFIFFVCYHVVPKRHSQLDYELNDG